jgi:hypothetical protein
MINFENSYSLSLWYNKAVKKKNSGRERERENIRKQTDEIVTLQSSLNV